MLPRGVTATDATWMKFQAPGTPAAVVGAAGHSINLYGRSATAGCWPSTDLDIGRMPMRRNTATSTNARGLIFVRIRRNSTATELKRDLFAQDPAVETPRL